MKIGEIVDFTEQIAPSSLALDYDNVGLLVGHKNGEVTKILTALDCNTDVVREAVAKGCELILCHHPVMFSGVKRITDETKEGEMLLSAIENNVAILAAHTNLDFADGGLNDRFLEKLGYEADGTIVDNEGRIFRCEITLGELSERIKERFDVPHVRVGGDLNAVCKVCALCTGSGKSLLEHVLGKADTFITGEMGHHDILYAIENGCNYVEISHYDSEKIAMELLKCKLDEKFDEIEVFISEENKNPLTFV